VRSPLPEAEEVLRRPGRDLGAVDAARWSRCARAHQNIEPLERRAYLIAHEIPSLLHLVVDGNGKKARGEHAAARSSVEQIRLRQELTTMLDRRPGVGDRAEDHSGEQDHGERHLFHLGAEATED
jgi:hypothetical protein